MTFSTTKLPKVVLIGRINVGKSSLFNRLVGRHAALTSPIPGTTRDRREDTVEWQDKMFTLVDTGGVEEPTTKQNEDAQNFTPLITKQTKIAIDKADIIILVTSANDSIMPQDQSWAKKLRQLKTPKILVVNKVDTTKKESALANFYSLGLGQPYPVSAINGRLTGDFLDVVVDALKKLPIKKSAKNIIEHDNERPLNIAVLGQPNSGKSSLLNAIVGEERTIISPVPHTTREPQDVNFYYQGNKICIIDTAGIGRKYKTITGIETHGINASLKTIDRANVVFMLIDVLRGPTFQDQRLATLITEKGKGLIIVANKWDLIKEKDSGSVNSMERTLRSNLPGLDWAPVIFISAKTKLRVKNLIELALNIERERGTRIDDPTLNDFLSTVIRQHRPARGGGVRHPSILSFKQVDVYPPHFELIVQGELHPSYLKFLENQLRTKFGFTGTSIRISMKLVRKKPKK